MQTLCHLLLPLGRRGSDWQREFDLWVAEHEAEWNLVRSKSFRKSYANIVKTGQGPKNLAKSVFLCLQYPANYHKNFLSSSPVHRPRLSSPYRNLNLNLGERILWATPRWTPKSTPLKKPSSISILGPAPPRLQPQFAPRFDPTQGPSLCSRCLGPGHFRKDCQGSIRGIHI